MSLLVTTDIQCDEAGCLEWYGSGVTGTGTRADAVRRDAKRDGWASLDGVDFCPWHHPDLAKRREATDE
jgi:hypothetical protein